MQTGTVTPIGAAPTLSHLELFDVTGYSRAGEQLAELHRLGFPRARIDRLGRCVLERAHYEAVCDGRYVANGRDVNRPRVREVGR